MPAPEVRVTIAGDNAKLDAELKKSEGSLGGFVKSAKGILSGLAAVATAAALGEFFRSSLEEAGKAETGIRRLGTAVTNAGDDFRAMQPEIEATITKFTRLTKHTDDDLRAALTNMVGLTGDTSESLRNLGLVTDLAAFKQIPLEEAATAVGKAMNGNVTAFNRMGIAGKDATVVLDQMRGQFAGFAEGEAQTFEGSIARVNNQWGEFKEAVGTAILSSGAMQDVTGKLVGVLVDLQDWVVRNEDAIGGMVSAIGNGTVAVGNFLGKVVSFVVELDRATAGVNKFFLDLFGITLPGAAADGFKKAQDVEADYEAATQRMAREHNASLAGIHAEAERNRLKAVEAASEERKKVEKEEALQRELIVRDVNILLTRSEEEMNKELAKQKVNWSAIAGEVERVQAEYRELLPLPKELNDFTGTSKKHVQATTEALEDQSGGWTKTVQGATSVARGLLDGANAMGVLSDEAANALGSVVNLASSVAQIAGGDTIGGIVGIVGSLANILSGLGTSPQERARLAAIAQNSRELQRLTGEIGDMNLSVSGRAFSGVQSALTSLFANVPAGTPRSGIILQQMLDKELGKVGLSTFDLDKIAKELGIDIHTDGWGGVRQLLDAMQNRTEFGQFGQGFEGQLDFAKSSVDILGLNTNQQLQSFTELAKKFSPAFAKALAGLDLNTPEGRAKAVANLQGLFAQLNAGTLKPEEIGVSGPQFLQLIQTLLPLLTSATGVQALPSTPTFFPIGPPNPSVAGPALSSGISGLGSIASGNGDTTITGDTQIGPFYVTPADGVTADEQADAIAAKVAIILGQRYTGQLTALGTPVTTGVA